MPPNPFPPSWIQSIKSANFFETFPNEESSLRIVLISQSLQKNLHEEQVLILTPPIFCLPSKSLCHSQQVRKLSTSSISSPFATMPEFLVNSRSSACHLWLSITFLVVCEILSDYHDSWLITVGSIPLNIIDEELTQKQEVVTPKKIYIVPGNTSTPTSELSKNLLLSAAWTISRWLQIVVGYTFHSVQCTLRSPFNCCQLYAIHSKSTNQYMQAECLSKTDHCFVFTAKLLKLKSNTSLIYWAIFEQSDESGWCKYQANSCYQGIRVTWYQISRYHGYLVSDITVPGLPGDIRVTLY